MTTVPHQIITKISKEKHCTIKERRDTRLSAPSPQLYDSTIMFSVAGGLPTLVTPWAPALRDLSMNWEAKQQSTYIHAQNLMQIQFQELRNTL